MSAGSFSTTNSRRDTLVPPAESPAEAEARSAKSAQILAACSDGNLSALVQLATSTHGLLNDRLRRTACTPLETHSLCTSSNKRNE
jgi:hypothetical protein